MTGIVIPTPTNNAHAFEIAQHLDDLGRLARTAIDLGEAIAKDEEDTSEPLLKLVEQLASGILSVHGSDVTLTNALLSVISGTIKEADPEGEVLQVLKDQITSLSNAVVGLSAILD